jgi:hypothetical protein
MGIQVNLDQPQACRWNGPSIKEIAGANADLQMVAARYPNYIPFAATAIERTIEALQPFEYDRVYGAF